MSNGVQRGGPQPQCFTDYRTGQQTGNCTQPSAPSDAPSPSTPAAAAPPPPPSMTPSQNITYNIAQPPPITVPGAGDGNGSPIAPTAAPPQQPQSMIALGNQMKKPLDEINEDAMPSLRDGLGRRTPPSMAALFAQMARVY